MSLSLLKNPSGIAGTAVAETNEHNVHPIYRADIDGLRAIAILAVVVFHAFPTVVGGGFVGVDVFFVISGFLISSIIFKSLKRGDFKFTEFYANRVRRIFPALILVLVVCYVTGWFALLADEYKQLGKHMAGGAGFLQNFVLLQEAGYFDTTSELKPLMHLWSLAVEEQFYVLFPALIWCTWRMGLNVLTTVFLLGAISFYLNINGVEDNATRTFFSPQTRFWELMVGAVLAHLHSSNALISASSIKLRLSRWAGLSHVSHTRRRREAVVEDLIAILGLLLILFSALILNKGNQFPGWWAVLPVLGASFLILAGPLAWVNRTLLANRVMVFIGMISYPLYLQSTEVKVKLHL